MAQLAMWCGGAGLVVCETRVGLVTRGGRRGSWLYARLMVGAASDVSRALGLVADAVGARECILFLGAGVHAPPPAGSVFVYPAELRPPVGSAFSRELAGECGLAELLPREDPGNLQRVALAYEIAFSRHQLVDAVTDAVHVGKEPSPMLRALAELDFPVVITTNYDQLFEQALRDVGKQPRVAIYTPRLEETIDYRKPTAQSPIVFKIHGDISRPETVVITDEDYIDVTVQVGVGRCGVVSRITWFCRESCIRGGIGCQRGAAEL